MAVFNNVLAGASGQTTGGAYEIERSLRFNSSDSAYLSRTPASAGNRKTWTWAGWVKRSALGGTQYLFSAGTSAPWMAAAFSTGGSADQLQISFTAGVSGGTYTNNLFRDASAWYHILFAVDTTQATAANRIKVYVNGVEATFSSTNYPSQNSDTQVNDAVLHTIGRSSQGADSYFSGYLADIHFIDGQALDPTSFTETDATTGQLIPKAYSGGHSYTASYASFFSYSNVDSGSVADVFDGSTATEFEFNSGGGNGVFAPQGGITYTTSVEVYSARTTTMNVSLNGGANVAYGNGWTTIASGSGTLNTLTFSNGSAGNQKLGAIRVDGVILTTGTFDGANSFHLPFSDNSTAAALGTDTSGNGNDWTVSPNISVAAGAGNDSLVDTPTNGSQTDTGVGGEVVGNYATLNPLDYIRNLPTNGNLDLGGNSTYLYTESRSTIWLDPTDSSGYYCEFTIVDVGTNPAAFIQLVDDTPLSTSDKGSSGGVGIGARGSGGGNTWWLLTGISSGADTGISHADGQIISVAVKNGKMYIAIDNTWILSSDPVTETNPSYSGLSGLKSFLVGTLNGSTSCNFGQRPFAYTAPSGFKALCTTNLPDPVVAQPSTVMDVATDTGANILTSTKALCGGNANFLWIKDRVNNSTNHHLIDIVRDPQLDGTPFLASNSTDDEATLGTYSAPSGNSVGWGWYAGGSTVTLNPGDPGAGSITSQVRANPSAGFSIVTYTGNGTAGATVGHGLNAAPYLIITKNRDNGSDPGGRWYVYHNSLGNDYTLFLHSNSAEATTSSNNNTDPTATVFSRGSFTDINATGNDYVAYCFAPVDGYSSFGSYTGNGSADGPFVYTGFRPRFVILKSSSYSDSYTSWVMQDSSRGSYNVINAKQLYANKSSAEGLRGDGVSAANPERLDIDFLSNGFKLRGVGNEINQNATTYIYAAFAENPFQYARAR